MARTMGRMAWSEDTRCLYCEGRLPLYRKITHGQFCSNAHRKAYWEEQERLAVERLHQSHNSLRAHRSSLPEEVASRVELAPAENIASLRLPEADQAPQETPFAVPELTGYLRQEIRPCYSCSLHFIVTEPSEYETVLDPLSPSGTWASPEAGVFPLGERVSTAKLFALRAWPQTAAAGASAEYDAEPV